MTKVWNYLRLGTRKLFGPSCYFSVVLTPQSKKLINQKTIWVKWIVSTSLRFLFEMRISYTCVDWIKPLGQKVTHRKTKK